ncbi:MAG TPA: bifunctional (p)ppGpp synthetase/guanosine-3',5'-bis(diphosphate) 3'-pyrophosphohydrolase [Thermoanaerobaculia bacterium]|nr:bifunctional (p)ppGpp synthetase/guanosine-3',5'-bis(diphosphate) 3'-pyrophosphohydrolase [Thermoanaerobaculia bacterium]
MRIGRKSPPPPPVAALRPPGFEAVLARLEAHGRPYDAGFLRRVYEYTAEKHKDQFRRSGEPYLSHPLAVAYLLADQRSDQIAVAVGLLHDVIEDTLVTADGLASEFGPEIAALVEGVTKIGKHAYVRRDEAQAETFRKMILASAKDLRIILVKLADRLHNMMTLGAMSPEARRRISQETVEIYAPIAHRLGMARVRGDLEDLAFYYLYPLQYAALREKIDERMKVGQEAMREVRERLVAALSEAGIEAEISFRIKRFYSIFQKLRRQGIDISELYDYLAFRIITTSLRDSYAALGVVHQLWRPIPGRFKDYIAMPKPNLYQSLHTTLLGKHGQPFEVQIRTREMDLVAEEGIAAHWRYKEGKLTGQQSDPNILWLRQLLDWQGEVTDSRSFLSALKIDLYPDEVYVLSPKGDVLAFPRGATPLDFAYRIHTDLGHRCSGARVNGRLVPLRTQLRNGDIVEIISSASRHPSRDWLNLVVTSRAKSKIRQWLNTQQVQQATELGRRLLEKELRRYKESPKKVYEGAKMKAYLVSEGLARPEDLFARIGFGKLMIRQVLAGLLTPEQLATEPERPGMLREAVGRLLPRSDGPISVRGHGDLMAVLAKCCNPLPGEEIVGYVTRGRGVSVHAADCPNVRNLLYNPEREIEVEWARQKDSVYAVSLTIETEDRPGILARLTEVIAKAGSNIREIEADTARPGRGRIEVLVEVRDRRHLDEIRRNLRSIAGVLAVNRQMTGPAARGEGL